MNNRQKTSCQMIIDFKYSQVTLLPCNVVESNESDENAERSKKVN